MKKFSNMDEQAISSKVPTINLHDSPIKSTLRVEDGVKNHNQEQNFDEENNCQQINKQSKILIITQNINK